MLSPRAGHPRGAGACPTAIGGAAVLKIELGVNATDTALDLALGTGVCARAAAADLRRAAGPCAGAAIVVAGGRVDTGSVAGRAWRSAAEDTATTGADLVGAAAIATPAAMFRIRRRVDAGPLTRQLSRRAGCRGIGTAVAAVRARFGQLRS